MPRYRHQRNIPSWASLTSFATKPRRPAIMTSTITTTGTDLDVMHQQSFAELGMELEGKGQVEGIWADRTVGLDGVRSDIAMMRTPDGHSKLELTRYHTPAAVGAEPENPPPNTLGLHRVMFAVDDINDTVARLRAHGAELLGEVAQYESIFLLCYLRGPAGIIVALAEQIG